MNDVMTTVHLGSVFLVVLVTGLMAVGFVRLAYWARGLVGHLARGILAIHLAILLRTLYRDVLPLFVMRDAAVFAPAVMFSVAVALNVLIALAGWHGLRALYLAIPEPARGRYSLLTAALYPPFRRR